MKYEPKQQMKTTYFVRSGRYLKIGQSVNPKSRLATISTTSPFPCELIKVDPRITEAEAKKVAESLTKRVNGEWFEINPGIEQWLGICEMPSPYSIDNKQSMPSAKKIRVTYHMSWEEFPADVQEFISERAIREMRPVEEVIAESVVETARGIVRRAEATAGAA